jgi:L-amino acid N-acyltransferase YncA
MPSAGTAVLRHFPLNMRIAGEPVTMRLATPGDRESVLRFLKSLPDEDLFYLMDDIRSPAGMDRWMESVREQLVTTVVAESGGGVIGYAGLRRGHAQWTNHLGEIRIMVSPEWRGRGLGKLLAKEVFALAHDLDLRRIVARLTSTQNPARYLFQHLGFHIEAVLAECVIDNTGRTQDLLVMSYDVSGFHG